MARIYGILHVLVIADHRLVKFLPDELHFVKVSAAFRHSTLDNTCESVEYTALVHDLLCCVLVQEPTGLRAIGLHCELIELGT